MGFVFDTKYVIILVIRQIYQNILNDRFYLRKS